MIVDLPPTSGEEYNAIVVFMCHLSKMVRILPSKTSLDARGFASMFFREIFPHYGMPQRIVSDRGSQWSSEFFQAVCDRAGVRLHMSTAYHPQTNGLVERTNEVIAAALRHFVSADQRDWDEYLPFIEYALNDMYRQSTQSTAFRMNRITLPKNPFTAISRMANGGSALSSELTTWLGQSTLSPGERTVVEAHERFAWARRCVHLAKERMKEKHDARQIAHHLYEVGQLVWLNVRNLSIRHPSMRQKLLPKYLGPLKVLEVIGRSAVKLDLPASMQIHPTVSVSLVKPFMIRAGVDLPPVVINGELEWEVDAVVDHNIVQTKNKKTTIVEFRVRWKGDYEDSWHEFVDFEHSIDSVQRYLKNNCTRAVRRRVLRALKPEELQRLDADLCAEAVR
jgi:hypothetical protein